MTDAREITDIAKLPPRDLSSHKGDYGRVAVVGGSADMAGSVALAARACFRGGAALVTMAVPQAARAIAASLCECATSKALSCDSDGFFSAAAAGEFARLAGGFDVLAVGCGMGTGAAGQMLIRRALAAASPLVLDADGLNNLSCIHDWPAVLKTPLVLTPHPGEMVRLTGMPAAEIQADRLEVAVKAASRWRQLCEDPRQPLVLILKGHRTVVTDGDRYFVNTTGNPGMATGGSGDVLTGVIAAFIAQGMDLFDAAAAGAYVHALAGDIAAEKVGQISLTATDIIDCLPQAIIKNQSR